MCTFSGLTARTRWGNSLNAYKFPLYPSTEEQIVLYLHKNATASFAVAFVAPHSNIVFSGHLNNKILHSSGGVSNFPTGGLQYGFEGT